MLADFDQLAAGVFAPPAPGDRSHRAGGPTGADALGVRFAGPETFKAWQQVPVAELWQWLALMTFLDPSSIPLESTLAKQVRPRSAVRLFQSRVALLSSLKRAAGDDGTDANGPGRSLVPLGEFTDWAQRIGLPLPAEFPRALSQKKGRRAASADPDYLRQSDLIPAMLPFSPATLWRKVNAGQFPAPVKLSAAVTAWRRDEVFAWLQERNEPPKRRRTTKA